MKGLQLSKEFYFDVARPLLVQQFPTYIDKIAVGLVGQGSECYGYDDDISHDHDFCVGFCLWINKELNEEIGYDLQRFYSRLPKEYKGVKLLNSSRFGGRKHGVKVIEEFFEELIGLESPPENWREWLILPDYALANATNGEIFEDKLGEFSKYYNLLKNGMPSDVRLKKLSAHLALMAQSGQYNYARCYSRNELGASQLAINEFVNHASYVIFNLNNQFMPFYKWRFRAMNGLSKFGDRSKDLEYLLMSSNSATEYKKKLDLIEEICEEIVMEIKSRQLSNSTTIYLEPHAIEVAQRIKDRTLKNMHLMVYN